MSSDSTLSSIPVLGFGNRFCPIPPHPKPDIYSKSIYNLVRNICWHGFWTNQPNTNREYDARLPLPKSNREPPYPRAPWSNLVDTVSYRLHSLLNTPALTHPTSNPPSLAVSKQLKQLAIRGDVKFMLSDKNLGLVAMDTIVYHREVLKHLNDIQTYRPINKFDFTEWILPHIQQRFKFFYNKHKKTFNEQQRKYLAITQDTVPAFHILPKLHKTPLSTRPIIGSPAWVSTTWSKFLDTQIASIRCFSVLANSLSLIRDIETNNLHIPPNALLVTADVSSLYTNIHLPTLYRYLGNRLPPNKQHLVDLLHLICEHNYFEYDSQIYHQFHGIAMGTNCAVSCANIYMDQFDVFFAGSCYFYRRYIDDIFFIWTKGPRELQILQHEMNAFLPRINLTFSSSPTSVAFLDLNIIIDSTSSSLYVTTYQKPINRYGYLPPFSHHPIHVLKGFISGELIRYLRTNTRIEDFKTMKTLLWSRLLKRGYKTSFLLPLFSSITFDTRQHRLQAPAEQERTKKIFPLIIPFHRTPLTSAFQKEIFSLNQEVENFLPPVRLLTAFTIPPNIYNLLCRSRLTDSQRSFLDTQRVPRGDRS